jgi:hypothetical protein
MPQHSTVATVALYYMGPMQSRTQHSFHKNSKCITHPASDIARGHPMQDHMPLSGCMPHSNTPHLLLGQHCILSITNNQRSSGSQFLQDRHVAQPTFRLHSRQHCTPFLSYVTQTATHTQDDTHIQKGPCNAFQAGPRSTM